MSEAVNEKEAQFERLWAGETPKGVNRTKALKFRQYMKQHVLQKYHKRRNCLLYTSPSPRDPL